MSARPRIVTVLVAAVVLPLLVAGGAEAKSAASSAARCEAEPVVIDEQSETTLTPAGTRIIITQEQCNGPSESSTPAEVVVTVNPTGTHEYVAAVVRGAMYSQSNGGVTERKLALHLPIPKGSGICVVINGEKTCLPPGSSS